MAEDAMATWDDLLPQPSSFITRTTWDFAPFLTAPAVRAKSPEAGRVNILNIPLSKIPSPLANNITPRMIIDIRESLIGQDGEGGYGGSGMEIWLSWKRAWDLWNNHYIEGRVNPVWVGAEWERRVKAQEEWDRNRDQRRREAERQRVEDAGAIPPVRPNFDPELSLSDSPRQDPGWERPDIPIYTRVATRPHHGPIVFHNTDVNIDDLRSDHMIYDDDNAEPSNSEPPADPIIDIANQEASAGWFPMRKLEEYDEPLGRTSDGKPWIDNVTNTVWRPRRVGEKTLHVDLDKDIEDFRKAEFTDDGGVDCGRSPFPVLRPVTQYVRTDKGAFRKKKTWDGVTGTTFNMPTEPLEPCPETEDDRIELIKNLYSDPIRDGEPQKLFPFEVRRVLKVAPELEKPKSICDEGETLVRGLELYPEKKYRAMKEDDPWWVTESQRLARDAPPRSHPLKEITSLGKLLPVEDQLWEEEMDRDLNLDAGYFVTNLHGGTLVVNGMEVRKGDVAGPLPAFAIIECPGGQIAFWWGVGGRHYGAAAEQVAVSYDKWETLRQQYPGWEHVAETAGDVWDAKIRDRKEREEAGEDEEDDDEWTRYKQTKASAKRPSERAEDHRQPGRYGPVPAFANDDAELEWLFFQAEETRRMLAVNQKALSLTYPKEVWGGAVTQAELTYELSEVGKHRDWKRRFRDLQKILQTEISQKLVREKADRRAHSAERVKRQAVDHLQSDRKRIKTAEKARKVAAARQTALDAAWANVDDQENFIKHVEEICLSDAASRAAMFGNSGLNPSEQVVAFQQWKRNDGIRLERERLIENQLRKTTGQPEIPPTILPEDQEAVETANKLALKILLYKQLVKDGRAAQQAKISARITAAREARAAAQKQAMDEAANHAQEPVDHGARGKMEAIDAALERWEKEKQADALNKKLQDARHDREKKPIEVEQAKVADKRVEAENIKQLDVDKKEADRQAKQDAKDEEGRKQAAEATKKAQELADLKAKQDGEADVERRRRAAAKVFQDSVDLQQERLERNQREAEAANKAQEEKVRQQAQQVEAERKRLEAEAVKIAQEAAEQDEAERQRLTAEAAKKAEDLLAKNREEQAETIRNLPSPDAAFAKTFAGRLQMLRITYYATPEGQAKAQAAKAYNDLQSSAKNADETRAYVNWLANLKLDELYAIQQTSTDVQDTIKGGTGSGPVIDPVSHPPESFFEKPYLGPIQIQPPPGQSNILLPSISGMQQTPTTSKFPPPSNLDQQLAHALAEGDDGSLELQKALEASFQASRDAAVESLKVRAASMNLTGDEWARREGFASAAAYLAAQMKIAKDNTKPPSRPTAHPLSDPTDVQREASNLAYWKDNMYAAIRAGISDRAKRLGMRHGLALARDKGKASVEAWADEILAKMNIKVDNVPSKKPVSAMTPAEKVVDDYLWKQWVARLNKVADWEYRIAQLPAPSSALKRVDAAGKLYANI